MGGRDGRRPRLRRRGGLRPRRFASALGLDPQAPRAGLSEFSDADDVSPFARDALSWAVGRGLVRGMGDTGLLAPQGGSTRAQTATLLVRFCREFLMEG